MNVYKNINQLSYLPTNRILKILELDIRTIKAYFNDITNLTNNDIEDIIGEIELIEHIIKLRINNIIPNEK